MASNQTEHYALSQWAADDSFLREEFNADHVKIDDALEKKCEVVFGCYQGTQTSENRVQIISLGFTPKAVLLVGRHGLFTEGGSYYGGLGIAPGFLDQTGTRYGLELVEGGFRVETDSPYAMNHNGANYYFIAFP